MFSFCCHYCVTPMTVSLPHPQLMMLSIIKQLLFYISSAGQSSIVIIMCLFFVKVTRYCWVFSCFYQSNYSTVHVCYHWNFVANYWITLGRCRQRHWLNSLVFEETEIKFRVCFTVEKLFWGRQLIGQRLRLSRVLDNCKKNIKKRKKLIIWLK